MAIENGGYENMSSVTVMKDSYQVSSGHLVQIDKNGNMRVIRLDFTNAAVIKDPFVISTPDASGSHLTKYTNERGNSTNNKAPVMAADAITIDDNSDTEDEIVLATLKFKSGTDDDFVHHYVITVEQEGSTDKPTTFKILTDFYRHAKVEDMKKEWTLDFGMNFTRGAKYTIKLTAYDSWDAASNTLVYEYTPKLDMENVKIPDVYADIDLNNGTITDAKGKLTIENVGAIIENSEVSFSGKTKTLPTLNIKEAGQYVKLTFGEYDTASKFTSMVQKDFAIEVLYVNRSKSGTQGIVSGYGKYGLGFYETNGTPAFQAHMKGSFQTLVANDKPSADEYVHVIATYAKSSALITIYVNGNPTTMQVGGLFRS